MSMPVPDAHLFFGFPVTDMYEKSLSALPVKERELFIQKGISPYLEEKEMESVRYLGKRLDSPFLFSSLDNARENILSLLKRLVPSFPYEKYPLQLIAFIE